MSCIIQILKLRDKDGLVKLMHENRVDLVVEGGGEYRGYEFIITFTNLGHRCGYVAVPPHHPINAQEAGKYSFVGEDELNVHGGITFSKRTHILKKLLPVPCDDLWIGFDCAHCYDGKDMALVEKYYGSDDKYVQFYKENPGYLFREEEEVKEFSYVEIECRRLIDQLIDLEKAA